MVKKKNSKSRRQSRDFELIPQKLGSDRLLYKMHVTYITWSKKGKNFEPIRSPHFRIRIQNLQKTWPIKLYLQLINNRIEKKSEIFLIFFLRSRNFKHISFAIWWVIFISHMTHWLWLIWGSKLSPYLIFAILFGFPHRKYRIC